MVTDAGYADSNHLKLPRVHPRGDHPRLCPTASQLIPTLGAVLPGVENVQDTLIGVSLNLANFQNLSMAPSPSEPGPEMAQRLQGA